MADSLVDAYDQLCRAVWMVECIYMACAVLAKDEAEPIRVVLDVALRELRQAGERIRPAGHKLWDVP